MTHEDAYFALEFIVARSRQAKENSTQYETHLKLLSDKKHDGYCSRRRRGDTGSSDARTYPRARRPRRYAILALVSSLADLMGMMALRVDLQYARLDTGDVHDHQPENGKHFFCMCRHVSFRHVVTAGDAASARAPSIIQWRSCVWYSQVCGAVSMCR